MSAGHLVVGERSMLGSITGTPFENEKTLDFSVLAGVMRINDDLTIPMIIQTSELPWLTSPAAGVDRRMLFRIVMRWRAPSPSCPTRRTAHFSSHSHRRRRNRRPGGRLSGRARRLSGRQLLPQPAGHIACPCFGRGLHDLRPSFAVPRGRSSADRATSCGAGLRNGERDRTVRRRVRKRADREHGCGQRRHHRKRPRA